MNHKQTLTPKYNGFKKYNICDRLAFGWDRLRNVCNLSVVSYTALLPFFGYLIIGNEKIVELLNISSNFILRDNNIFQLSTILQFIYIALFLIGVGEIVYKLRCPKDVIKYSQEGFIKETIEAGDLYLWRDIKDEVTAEKSICSQKDKDSINAIAWDFWEDTGGARQFCTENRALIVLMLRRYYELKSIENTPSRFASTLLLGFGLLILTLISITSIVNVFLVMASNIL